MIGLGAARARADEQKTLNATVVGSKDKAAVAPAATVAGDSTVCTQGKNKRMVALSYGDEKTKLPCQVHYKKETEQPGHDQVVFKADHDVAFCQSKAQAFVDKLSGMGWTCAKGG
jgi:hypothetical protein